MRPTIILSFLFFILVIPIIFADAVYYVEIFNNNTFDIVNKIILINTTQLNVLLPIAKIEDVNGNIYKFTYYADPSLVAIRIPYLKAKGYLLLKILYNGTDGSYPTEDVFIPYNITIENTYPQLIGGEYSFLVVDYQNIRPTGDNQDILIGYRTDSGRLVLAANFSRSWFKTVVSYRGINLLTTGGVDIPFLISNEYFTLEVREEQTGSGKNLSVWFNNNLVGSINIGSDVLLTVSTYYENGRILINLTTKDYRVNYTIEDPSINLTINYTIKMEEVYGPGSYDFMALGRIEFYNFIDESDLVKTGIVIRRVYPFTSQLGRSSSSLYRYSFTYQKIIPIRIISNYEVGISNVVIPITIDTKTLIQNGIIKADCSDIAVSVYDPVNDVETLAKFWIDFATCNTPNTVIYVKIPNYAINNDNLLFVYVGSPDAVPSVSKETFYWFVDFSSPADYEKISIFANGTASYSITNQGISISIGTGGKLVIYNK